MTRIEELTNLLLSVTEQLAEATQHIVELERKNDLYECTIEWLAESHYCRQVEHRKAEERIKIMEAEDDKLSFQRNKFQLKLLELRSNWRHYREFLDFPEIF